MAVAAVVVFAASTAAEAATVTWTFQNATFENEAFSDGVATVTGGFDFDADTNVVSNINILIEGAGSHYGGVDFDGTYDQPIFWFGTSAAVVKSTDGPDFTDDARLRFSWATSLTNMGGLVALDQIGLWRCPDAPCAGGHGASSLIDMTFNGHLTAAVVPLPAAGLLFLSALGAFGAMGALRRRRSLAA